VLCGSHGSMHAMRGVPMGVTAAQLGHSDMRMTEKDYAHLAPSYIAETIRARFPTLGITKDGAVKALRCKSLMMWIRRSVVRVHPAVPSKSMAYPKVLAAHGEVKPVWGKQQGNASTYLQRLPPPWR
jgi:hypothetical protein